MEEAVVMYFHQCLAYENIQGELRIVDDVVAVDLKTNNAVTGVMLSYTQLKTLSDGILSLLGKISVENLLSVGKIPVSGDMTITFNVPEETNNKEDISLCQQQLLSAQTENACLSKSA